MSDINNLKASSGSVIKKKLSANNEKLAEIRQRQRRERKEELYSYSKNSSKANSQQDYGSLYGCLFYL